jgi:hypothetical protein
VQTEISVGENTVVVQEGQTLIFTITTKNIRSGTRFYYSITGITAEDLSAGSLSGFVEIDDGTAQISLTLSNDVSWQEGTETITVRVRRDRVDGPQIGQDRQVTVLDTSRAAVGQFDTSANTSWTVPTGVTRISIVCIGTGGYGSTNSVWNSAQAVRYYYAGAGGGGGGLAYANIVPVSPGEKLTITRTESSRTLQGESSVTRQSNSVILCRALSGMPGVASTGGRGGGWTHGTGGSFGGYGGSPSLSIGGGGGGGGAAGYSGNGGDGGATGNRGGNGRGGGAGGGGGGSGTYSLAGCGGGGGGVYYWGVGADGAGSASVGGGGGGGSQGTSGGGASSVEGGTGGIYGGGGGGGTGGGGTISSKRAGPGRPGVIRIIWPGDRRFFPSTNTQNF